MFWPITQKTTKTKQFYCKEPHLVMLGPVSQKIKIDLEFLFKSIIRSTLCLCETGLWTTFVYKYI